VTAALLPVAPVLAFMLVAHDLLFRPLRLSPEEREEAAMADGHEEAQETSSSEADSAESCQDPGEDPAASQQPAATAASGAGLEALGLASVEPGEPTIGISSCAATDSHQRV